MRRHGRSAQAARTFSTAEPARCADCARAQGDERANFSRQVFVAEFGQGLPIGDRATLGALLAACGVDPAAALERAESDANKALLKAEAAKAAQIGVIGAPCLVTSDGEVFWGNDRLEQALDWAARARIGGVG